MVPYKYTHHTFSPTIKHSITTTADKYPGKTSFIVKNMKNPTGLKLCVSHKTATSRGPPLKSYRPKSVVVIVLRVVYTGASKLLFADSSDDLCDAAQRRHSAFSH